MLFLNKQMTSKEKIFNWVLFFTLLYIFIAYLPSIWGIKPGLDPSWSYGISKASEGNLIYGKDIIFTYGPLGYLIAGASLTSNFMTILIFRWVVHFTLLGILFLRIITLDSYLKKIIISLGVIFGLMLGSVYVGVGMGPDYQILFIYSIILTFEDFCKKQFFLISIILGCLTGFAILTKLTLGIYLFGMFYLLILSNILKLFIQPSEYTNKILAHNFMAICNFTLAFISTFLILFSPVYFKVAFTEIIVGFSFALVVGIFIWKILKAININPDSWLAKGFINYRNMPFLIFYLVYGLLLIKALILDSSMPPIMTYLTTSWEIASGYSSAMSLIGVRRVLLIGIACYILFAIMAFLLSKKRVTNFAIPFLFASLLSFKHGFVRQDDHIFAFFIIIVFIASLYLASCYQIKITPIHLFIYMLIYLLSFSVFTIELNEIRRLSRLKPSYVLTNTNKIINLSLGRLSPDVFPGFADPLKEVKSKLSLPETIKNIIKDRPIDIVPFELSLAPANNLNWQPRPIFQSYLAYTMGLDNINYLSLSENPRDYIIYRFIDIDERHPFFSEPKTFFYLFCNYQPTNKTQGTIKTKNRDSFILLERQNHSRCSPKSSSAASVSIPWNYSYSFQAKEGVLTLAKVKMEYSLLGKIYKTLFRIPPIMVEVIYEDGLKKNYRMIPENSGNGIVISNLPRNEQEAEDFFHGDLPAPVRSLTFSTSNQLMFKPQIELSFFSFAIGANTPLEKPQTVIK